MTDERNTQQSKFSVDTRSSGIRLALRFLYSPHNLLYVSLFFTIYIRKKNLSTLSEE